MAPEVVREPVIASSGVKRVLQGGGGPDSREREGRSCNHSFEGGSSRSLSWVCAVGWAAPWR